MRGGRGARRCEDGEGDGGGRGDGGGGGADGRSEGVGGTDDEGGEMSPRARTKSLKSFEERSRSIGHSLPSPAASRREVKRKGRYSDGAEEAQRDGICFIRDTAKRFEENGRARRGRRSRCAA